MIKPLRPFVKYYGSKWSLAPRYPQPDHNTIIEPFAGGANYALHYYDRRVILVERNEKLAAVWRFLIRSSAQDIRALPLLESGQSTNDLPICQEARWFIGWWLRPSARSPYTKWKHGKTPIERGHTRTIGCLWDPRSRERIAAQVERINHWEIHCCSYEDAPIQRMEATWFVDPPYVEAGRRYKYGSDKIDYRVLARWCRGRRGQVIACENAGADWLPFEHLTDDVRRNHKAERPKRAEVVWTNSSRPARYNEPWQQLQMELQCQP